MVLLMERKIQIYFVDSDPKLAAQSLVDEHISSQIRNSVQILCNAHRVLDGIRHRLYDERELIFYKVKKIKSPWSIWCRESLENYFWIEEYLYNLLDEYKERFKKSKKERTVECQKISVKMSYLLQSPPLELKKEKWTNPPLTIPSSYVNLPNCQYNPLFENGYSFDDIVKLYRYWYILCAQYIKPYEVGKHNNPPSWLKKDRDLHQMISGNS